MVYQKIDLMLSVYQAAHAVRPPKVLMSTVCAQAQKVHTSMNSSDISTVQQRMISLDLSQNTAL